MPEPLYNGGFWNSYARTAGATSTGFSGYGFGSNGTNNLYANVGGGDSFNIKFYGTGLGLRYTASDTNGLIQFNVDGGDYKAMDFRNPGSNGGTNHKMLIQGLDGGWHEMNVILRKTVSGSNLVIHAFFIDGDPNQRPFTFGTPPTSAPLTEIFVADIVLTPKLLNTNIGTNNGSVRVIENAIIDDVNTISYVPNPSSERTVASDCYNGTFRSIIIPDYKYVTVGYHYVIPEGVTPSATRMMLRFLQLPLSTASLDMYSAQTAYKLNESDEFIFDITMLGAKGMDGNLAQMHFFPFGNIKGNQASDKEKMHIKNVIFHPDYPYDASPVALDLAESEVSASVATSDTKDGADVTKVVASGKAALSFEGLEDLEMFPSVYTYAQMEYFAESGEGVSFVREKTNATTGEVTTSTQNLEYLATALNGDVEVVFSSDKMTYGVIGIGYTKSFNGNATITMNKGNFAQGIQMGMSYSDTFTVSGNATLIINGGTFTNNDVNFTNYQANTGAKTIIYNNDMKSTGPNSTNFDYIIDSSLGGEVYISTQATATTAPTFTAKVAKKDCEILFNGESVGFGEYTFTPTATGTYTVDFVVPTYTDLADVTVEFTKIRTNSPIIKTVETDGFAYNSFAKISLYTEAGTLIDSALETELENGAYTFEGIMTGKYYIVVEKNGYLTYTSDVFDIDADATLPLDDIELIPCDINDSYDAFVGDGVVDIVDLIRLIRAFASDTKKQLQAITDIDEDGTVGVSDLAQLISSFGKTISSYKQNN